MFTEPILQPHGSGLTSCLWGVWSQTFSALGRTIRSLQPGHLDLQQLDHGRPLPGMRVRREPRTWSRRWKVERSRALEFAVVYLLLQLLPHVLEDINSSHLPVDERLMVLHLEKEKASGSLQPPGNALFFLGGKASTGLPHRLRDVAQQLSGLRVAQVELPEDLLQNPEGFSFGPGFGVVQAGAL